jgi:Ser/Thr protein kinase RdoA (MazF antagonist)
MYEEMIERRAVDRSEKVGRDAAWLELASRKRALMRQLAEWLGWDTATMAHLYSSHVVRVSDEQ